ncbi:adenylate/guanylate cyclase domain-containing protein [Pseudoalteromonas luteoviolacea]|uniref:adenylate/guanylate cyclase domain-containing protein n=1 Tax=Pseudoalteromonas luteoviolacea TaxID=43657 RepID=UPI001B37F952|nr:adenylate/guanylate cyclase domain-containing protein [Pseudoalteromonas luteoviolacea]MBQ4834803.1 adenylate/guanylate cyclase domain-containing protein [Pseudoalteromonas luteoviolacea]
MKWLKDIDESFDVLLTDCYQQREMEMEFHINQIRFVGLMSLFLLELFIGLLNRGVDWTLIIVDVGTMALTAIWCLCVARFAKSEGYKPWLKYVSILFDYLIILAITLEMEFLSEIGHFLHDMHNTEFELMLISALILFNVMSAFRQGKLIIYYSTLCCLATGTVILEHSGTARAIEMHEQIIILFSGLLAWSISSYITNTYTRLRHRERLLRYLPKKLVSAVETGKVDIEPGGERRNVTVLMADIRRFTSLCESHEPEVITGLLNRYFSAMSVIVFKYDGMVDKFIGDAIMAIFGTPQDEGNSARNAIDAAKEMLQALEALNKEFIDEGLPSLEIGIGVHSGEAIAGNVGSVSCMDYTVIGDTVNVAARIESKTKDLEKPLLISKVSVMQSEHNDLQKAAEVTLKGRIEPIEVFFDPSI